MNPRRLAQGGALSAPRPLLLGLARRAAAQLQAAPLFWLVWTVWWFAAGALIGWERAPCPI